MSEKDWYIAHREKAQDIFTKTKSVLCPYFQRDIVLNADGLHHLRYSARRERSKQEQVLKFSLVPLALRVIRKSGTIQEYRKSVVAVGKAGQRDGFTPLKSVEYWGLVAIIGDPNMIKVRVILRRIGDGNIIFWSVMPFGRLTGGGRQKLSTGDLENE